MTICKDKWIVREFDTLGPYDIELIYVHSMCVAAAQSGSFRRAVGNVLRRLAELVDGYTTISLRLNGPPCPDPNVRADALHACATAYVEVFNKDAARERKINLSNQSPNN